MGRSQAPRSFASFTPLHFADSLTPPSIVPPPSSTLAPTQEQAKYTAHGETRAWGEMKIVEYIARVFAFRNTPTTVLLFAVYIAAFASVLLTDELPRVPKSRRGAVDEAYADLQAITSNPHPYNSHANDHVHSYIYYRLHEITRSHNFAHLVEDKVSNYSAASAPYSVYFEGTNLLVKIDGTDADAPGVLFSAHYDSVSSAPGATDDGMGVVTLIQTVNALVEKRPRRTAVFNVNNGEEDFLNGARAFLKHPWSNLTDIFINLEGAASGGRPILFRATSTAPVQSFSSLRVRRPHGNVLSADAFARGVIRSATDYSVYLERPGKPMEGLDFAFYKGRSLYHTKYDATPYTVGGREALSAMLDTCLDAGDALLNSRKISFGEATVGGKESVPVYFDLFGFVLINFSLSTLFVSNIVLLVVGPLLVLLTISVNVIIQHKRHERLLQQQAQGPRQRTTTSQHVWQSFKRFGWVRDLWKVAKFWLAVVFTVGFQVLLAFGYMQLNPHVVYSSPYLILLSTFTLTYVTLFTTLSIPLPFTHSHQLPEQQKNLTLLQLYIFTGILLVLTTISGLGGTYPITMWNAVVWVGVVFGIVEGMVGARGSDGDERAVAVEEGSVVRTERDGDGEQQHAVRLETPGEVDARERREQQSDHDGHNTDRHEDGDEEEEEEPTERTPLVRRILKVPSLKKDDAGEDGGAIGWWAIQLILTVPVPVILVLHILVILVGAIPQTIADGNSPVTVYAAFSLCSLLLLLPMTPFAFKMHRWVVGVLVVLFVLNTAWTMLVTPPFDETAPLKVYFQQTVDIRRHSTPGDSTRKDTSDLQAVATTTLTGLDPYVRKSIVQLLPSSRGKNVTCAPAALAKRAGLWDCTWDTSEKVFLPVPQSNVSFRSLDIAHPDLADSSPSPSLSPAKAKPLDFTNPYFSYSLSHPSHNTTRFTILPTNSRACRVYFDSGLGDLVHSWRVRGSGDGWVVRDKEGAGVGVGAGGKGQTIDEVRLWSRTWGREFVLDVQWAESESEGARYADKDKTRTARIACEYAEYQSGSVGVNNGGARIPAMEEVVRSLPKWAVVTKANDGLAEVWEEVRV